MSSRRWSSVLLALLVLIPVALVAHSPLTERDEAIHTEVAREILKTGDWTTMHFAGRPWYDKPPLTFWAVAASMEVFGVNEAAARIPIAIACGLLVLTVWWLGREMYNENAGLAGAAITASCPMIAGIAQSVLMDVPLVLLFTLTLALFYQATRVTSRSGVVLASLGAGVVMGLGVLTKGPVAIVLPGAIALAAMVWSKDLRPRWRPAVPFAVIVCLIVAVPWHYLVYRANGMAWVDTYLGFHNVTRYLRSEHGGKGDSVLLYLGVLVIGFVPWTAATFGGFVRGCTRRSAEDKLLVLWTLGVLVFFGVASTRLAAYILPAFPALALLGGRFLTEEEGKRREALWPWALNVALVLAVGVALVAITGRFPSARTAALVWAAVLLVAAALQLSGSFRRSIGVLLVAGCALLMVVDGLVVPAAGAAQSLKRLVQTADRAGGRLLVWNDKMPGSVLFYSHKPAMLADRVGQVAPGDLVLIREKDVHNLGQVHQLVRNGRWVLVRKE